MIAVFKAGRETLRGEFLCEQIMALKEVEKHDAFGAYFWAQKVLWMNNGDVTDGGNKVLRTANGEHYTVCPENAGMKGHAGRKFNYKYIGKDEEYVTTNLWSQGRIPEELKDILKPNAIIWQSNVKIDPSRW